MPVRAKSMKDALKYQKGGGESDWSTGFIIQKIKSLEKRILSDEAWIAKLAGTIIKLNRKG